MNFDFEIPRSQPDSDKSLVEGDIDTALNEHVPEWTSSDVRDIEMYGEQVSELNESRGVEALASYRSFRRGGSWGITINRTGIQGIAWILHSKTGLAPKVCIKTAYRVLYAHERFHFQVDCAYLSLELWMKHLDGNLDPMSDGSLYLRSRNRFPTYDPLEEALANARAWRYLNKELMKPKRPTSNLHLLQHIEAFLLNSPTGYRDFEKFSGTEKFFAGLDSLMSPGVDLTRKPRAGGFKLLVDLDNSKINGNYVPTYIQ